MILVNRLIVLDKESRVILEKLKEDLIGICVSLMKHVNKKCRKLQQRI